MRSSKFGLVLVFILSFLFIAPVFSLQTADESPTPPPLLRLHRGTFDARSQAATLGILATPAAGPYAIIQLQGPVTPADRQALQQTGVELLEYVPDFAYLVRGTPAQIQTAARLPQVYARIPFTLADKLAPGFQRAIQRGDVNMGRVFVVGWDNDLTRVRADLNKLPFDAHAELSRGQLLQIAALESVRWIEAAHQPRLLNDYARTIMGVDTVWQNAPLYGNGQIIGITDSGLDTGNMSTLSPDFTGRIAFTQTLVITGTWADEHGHGTHVAGSAAGAGVQSGSNPATHDYTNSFAGVAPEAQLSIQAFEADPSTGAITGIPSDYYTLFDQMYQTGAKLHSNSWGDVTGPIGDPSRRGGYVFGTRRTDQFIWQNPDMTIFAAAGNSGVDGVLDTVFELICSGGDGVIDIDSLLSPGTAKNVVTVGASESNKNTGPTQGVSWLLINPFCFTVDPIANDIIANNVNGMAAYSSRGPADDGRFKPDITAPGVNIVSNRSHVPGATALWGAYDANYVYSGGTSMATPLTAGMGALTREWLQFQGAAVPSAALVKAMLLNTTQNMAPGQYPLAFQEIPNARPNSVSGWGRVNLGWMDPPPGFKLWFDDHQGGLNTGDVVTYTHTMTRPLQVITDALPLRAMLVWTDPPPSPMVSPQLVNDLDLRVIGPGGAVYYGNDNASGDRLNNVEGVVINTPPMGQYTVTISAFNVPTATQPFALVVGGPIEDKVDLGLTKDDGGVTADPGNTLVYTLTYQNLGSNLATGVTITETVPVETSFNSAISSPGWSCSPGTAAGSTCTITIGSLVSLSSGSVAFGLDVNAAVSANATQIDNTATIGDDGSNGVDQVPANNIASDSTPLSNISQRCGLSAGNNYLFNHGGKDVTIGINNIGDIDCVQVVLTNSAHPNATSAMTDNYYWTLGATNASSNPASGYNVDLTFPHISINTLTHPPLACRFTPGVGWDCTGTQSYNATVVLRQGVTAFSDWAIGYNVGPTAIHLERVAVSSRPRIPITVAPLLFLSIGTLWGLARLVRRKEEKVKQ